MITGVPADPSKAVCFKRQPQVCQCAITSPSHTLPASLTQPRCPLGCPALLLLPPACQHFFLASSLGASLTSDPREPPAGSRPLQHALQSPVLSWDLCGSRLSKSPLRPVGFCRQVPWWTGNAWLFVHGLELVFITHSLIDTTGTCRARGRCCGQYKGFNTVLASGSWELRMCPDPCEARQKVAAGSCVASVRTPCLSGTLCTALNFPYS